MFFCFVDCIGGPVVVVQHPPLAGLLLLLGSLAALTVPAHGAVGSFVFGLVSVGDLTLSPPPTALPGDAVHVASMLPVHVKKV